jgi:hypothetical protein
MSPFTSVFLGGFFGGRGGVKSRLSVSEALSLAVDQMREDIYMTAATI